VGFLLWDEFSDDYRVKWLKGGGDVLTCLLTKLKLLTK
jgi:hypothetical protein